MYTACVWCYSELGQNDSIEHFPIGRRLAYDPAKGWLWVVWPKVGPVKRVHPIPLQVCHI
jgi:hypothetical protein